jgi:hypothetical protein
MGKVDQYRVFVCDKVSDMSWRRQIDMGGPSKSQGKSRQVTEGCDTLDLVTLSFPD